MLRKLLKKPKPDQQENQEEGQLDSGYFLMNYLISMPIGKSEKLRSGERLIKTSHDNYHVYDAHGKNMQFGDLHWVINAIMNTPGNSPYLGATSSGSLGSGLGAISWPQPPDPMTSEEHKELQDIEQELKAFIKQNKISKFKALPSHIRQEIVDDAYIRDFTLEIENNNEAAFPNAKRLSELRNKLNSGWNTGLFGGLASGYVMGSTFVSKYENVLRNFTTEELAKAHAEACLEEDFSK